ncbi:MAG TPA: hypothetical protein VIV60_30545 [Polyangiaceae bacterium]
MLLKKETWIAAYKKAVVDLKAKPTSGLVCALATLRVIRDGICDDLGKDSDESASVRKSMGELIQQIQGGPKRESFDLNGFASNASAAGKAAGLAIETFTEFVKD